MLRDRYAVDKFFIEIAEEATEMDPYLAQIDIDKVLEDVELFQQIKDDFSCRHAKE